MQVLHVLFRIDVTPGALDGRSFVKGNAGPDHDLYRELIELLKFLVARFDSWNVMNNMTLWIQFNHAFVRKKPG
jgi:hypothetical protein